MDVIIDPESVKRKLKFDYVKAKNAPELKNLDVFVAMASYMHRPQIVVHELIQDAANQIQRAFKLRWTMIGIRTPSDGLYRYEVMCGMRQDAWENQRARKYRADDFALKTNNYNAAEISKITRVYLEEDNPLAPTDLTVLSRPVLYGARRKELDDSLEADFLDTLIMKPDGELLGWIEYSGTITGKLPEASVVRSVEVIAVLLGAAMSMK